MELILERVLTLLRDGGIPAEAAFPGRMFPKLTDFAAAVHLHRADQAAGTVTVSVTVLGPAGAGGTACELEAVRAAALMKADGAVCLQGGCRFLGVEQVFAVEVLGTYSGPEVRGFAVYLDETLLGGAYLFRGEEATGAEPVYTLGSPVPEAAAEGPRSWKLRLEEKIPLEQWIPQTQAPGFALTVETGSGRERYPDCRWVTERREFTAEGVRRIREAIALGREEEVNE